MKESFTGPKKLDTIDTPHGKLTKAPEGGSLGDFQGQKVKAEMDFPDGHKAKSLDNGKCAVCSNCAEINKRFGPELEANPKIAAELKELEKRILANGDNVDPGLIARQKQLHDKLEVKKAINDYKATVKDGKFNEADIKTKVDAGERFNPDTKRFSNPSKTKEIDFEANPSQTQFGLGDKTSAPGKNGVQEINVGHSELTVKKQRKLKVAEETRVRAKAEKTAIEAEFNANGGYIDVEVDGSIQRITDLEQVPSYKVANQKMIKASESLGEISTDAVMNTALPGAKKLKTRSKVKNPNAKSGEFDAIYEHNGDIYLVESKGGGSTRGSREIESGKRAEHGTIQYRDDIILQMEKDLLRTGDPDLALSLQKIKDAFAFGEVHYMQVTQTVDKFGKITPQAVVNKFD